MVERNVVVRNLKSLEALGAVTDICSDKTGMSTSVKPLSAANTLDRYSHSRKDDHQEGVCPSLRNVLGGRRKRALQPHARFHQAEQGELRHR